MARKNSQKQPAKQKSREHVESWTGPKPPARVRPVSRPVEPKPVQPDTKPDNKPNVTPESPKPESPKPEK